VARWGGHTPILTPRRRDLHPGDRAPDRPEPGRPSTRDSPPGTPAGATLSLVASPPTVHVSRTQWTVDPDVLACRPPAWDRWPVATNLHSTAAALLGLLHEGPMPGGELVAAAKDRMEPFWSVT